MKQCKRGYYYCYTDKKCKRIPGGYRVTYGGYLRREKDSDNSETEDNKTNGNGSGNGNHSNGNGNGNGSSSNGGGNGGGGGVSEGWSSKYKRSIDCNNPKGFSQKAHCQGKEKMSEEKKDHEYSMARSQLKTIKNAASRLEKKMGKKGEGELKAWVQSKITKAADYIDTAADYVTNEETITEKRDGKSAKDKGYSLRDWFKGGGWKQAGGKYDGKPCAKQPGQTTKPYCRDADDRSAMSKDERDKRAAKKRKEDPNPDRKGAAKIVTQKNSFEPEGNLVDEGKKDACYHKVKSRYSVWPSAYASGALVKCRKKGAANWGNSTKKEEVELSEVSKKLALKADAMRKKREFDAAEDGNDKEMDKQLTKSDKFKSDENRRRILKKHGDGVKKDLNKNFYKAHFEEVEGYDFSNWRDDFKALQIDSFDIIKPEPLQATDGIGSRLLGEAKKCWKGYKKAGTQKLFGKTYNRCVKAGYEGNKTLSQFMEDWQKSNRKDGVDGMSQKSVNAYKRENPGSKLQTAVTTKPSKLKKGSKSAKRRSSYCSRSKGQKDMHNIDCTKTPDKKICKARKRWNC